MLLFFWHATICDIINKMKYKHYSAVCCIEDMKKSHTYSSTEILWVYICSKYWLDETRVSLATMSRKPVLAWNLHSTQNFFLILFISITLVRIRRIWVLQIPPHCWTKPDVCGLGNLYITCLHWNICLQYIYTWATHESNTLYLTFKNKDTGTKHIVVVHFFFYLFFLSSVHSKRLVFEIKFIISNQERFTRGSQKFCGLMP